MMIIASSNGAIGMPAAWDILQAGGSALDAVEAATRLVEDNPDDRHGNHCAVITIPGRTYVYQADGRDMHAELPRLVVGV